MELDGAIIEEGLSTLAIVTKVFRRSLGIDVSNHSTYMPNVRVGLGLGF